MLAIDTSDRGEQRKFGLVMAAVLVVLAVLRWWLKGAAPVWLFGAAAALAALGLLLPAALRPLFVAWIKLAEVLNWVMTRVLLSLVFYLVLTPTALLYRVLSGDPLQRAWDPQAHTYWEDAEPQPADIEPYRNQF